MEQVKRQKRRNFVLQDRSNYMFSKKNFIMVRKFYTVLVYDTKNH